MSELLKPVEMSDGHRYWNGEGGNTWARTMDQSEKNFATLSPVLMAATAAQPGEQVLDVGCGGGVTSRDLALQVLPGGAVVGLDISAPILDIARQRYGDVSNLQFEQADVGIADLPAQQFDLIFSRFGVMFFDDPPRAFANLQQALKPGGRLVFMCWQSMKQNPWMSETTAAALAQLPAEHQPQGSGDPFAPGPFALADPSHTANLLTSAGFSEVQITPLDDVMRLGDEETAVAYLSQLGPAGSALKVVSPDLAEAALDAMREVLRGHVAGGELNVPAATWIVTARS